MTGEQEKLFGLLETFDRICEENGLRYYLAGGTLLGAVRHKGFIPWDDDIDVIMPLPDYERLLALEPRLPANLVIQSERSDEDFPFLFVELCDTRIPFITRNRHGPRGLYIDVFPILPSCKPTKWAGFQFDMISVINYVLQVKCGWTSQIKYKKKLAQWGYWVLDKLTKRQLKDLRKNLARRLGARDEGYLLSVGGGHKGTVEFYPSSWFDKAEFLDFEGKPFPAPVGWDDYLRQLYGDYMVLPAEAERKTGHR